MSRPTETCAICAGIAVDTLTKTDDLALCNGHWNRWLMTFLGSSSEPPCGAHVIREPEATTP